jgi:hypothetical protein
MHSLLTDPSTSQTPKAAILGIPGADAIYGCVDWFFYQPLQPGREVAGAESPTVLHPPGAELALTY